MTTIKKIITHGGTAHTDELRACAIVLYLAGYDIPIERRDPTEEELAETLRERGELIRCHGFQCRHELRVVGILRQT